jgi:uncharacterized protein
MAGTSWFLPLLFVGGIAAGLVNSVAAGGGLVSLPLLLLTGVPPQFALGTNKFQSSFGNFTSAAYYVRHGMASMRAATVGIVFTGIGAAAGSWAVQRVSNQMLADSLPFLLLAILLYTVFTPDPGLMGSKPRMLPGIFYPITGLAFGFFDGFFGPGIGSFWVMALMFGLGLTLAKAIAYSKVMNCTSNLVAVLLFAGGNMIWFTAGLVMAAGQISGAWIGSRYVVRSGARFLRPLYIAFVAIATLKLFYDRFL